ncbi:MAG: S8 family serine peptidase [Bacteroidales bacterium]|nr:S8 family serine peptidase [Bacteroidales bacterium]
MKNTLLFLATLLISLNAVSQDETKTTNNNSPDDIYLNWYNKSPMDDTIYGAEVDKAYNKLLKDKKSTTVIVAVIDGGIDITHEDLKDNIWINKNEIPENGIDDDKNGYIDDIHGWNFLGNSKGENIAYENLEITRIYKQYNEKYSKTKSGKLSEEEKETYLLYKEAKKLFEKELKFANFQKSSFDKFKNRYNTTYSNISKAIAKDTITTKDLDSLKIHNKSLKKDIKFQYLYVKYGFTTDAFDEIDAHINEQLDYHLNVDYNPRDIIGDDINEISSSYGNNNVYGPESDHGTFVSGIIAAERDNEIGVNGIVENVKIMALKVVPNGDERDKDVAKAIRYAVDNGAKVINMSFGKQLSPQKQLVDDAIKYAEEKGVLLVHAAGNDGFNIDKIKQYPTKNLEENKQISTWITVGASSMNSNLKFAASFTNYGKDMVDIFAPGVRVKSLAPEDEYEVADGTSFSAPVVSGVAALLISYYPELTANDVKNIITKSALKYAETEVNKPGDYSKKKKTISFGDLSITGGIVSAYEALRLAEEMSK